MTKLQILYKLQHTQKLIRSLISDCDNLGQLQCAHTELDEICSALSKSILPIANFHLFSSLTIHQSSSHDDCLYTHVKAADDYSEYVRTQNDIMLHLEVLRDIVGSRIAVLTKLYL